MIGLKCIRVLTSSAEQPTISRPLTCSLTHTGAENFCCAMDVCGRACYLGPQAASGGWSAGGAEVHREMLPSCVLVWLMGVGVALWSS